MTATDHIECCVVLGVQHQRLAEGLRDLLASVYDPVVVAADERSLVDAAERLRAQLAVVSLSFGAGDSLGMLRRLRGRFPDMKLIVLCLEEMPTVERALFAAGADRLVPVGEAAFGLLPAADAVLAAPHNEGR